MDWIKWVIHLILMLICIMTNLTRVQPQPRNPQNKGGGPRPLPPDERGKPSREQHPKTALDDFLQEAQRRRREAERQRQPEMRPHEETPPPVKPLPQELGKRPDRQWSKPATSPPPLPRTTPPPLPGTTSAPVVVGGKPPKTEVPAQTPKKVPLPKGEGQSFDTPTTPALEAQQLVPPVVSKYGLLSRAQLSTVSTAAAEVLQMLSDSNSLRTAFLLHEVLGRPASQRRGNRY